MALMTVNELGRAFRMNPKTLYTWIGRYANFPKAQGNRYDLNGASMSKLYDTRQVMTWAEQEGLWDADAGLPAPRRIGRPKNDRKAG